MLLRCMLLLSLALWIRVALSHSESGEWNCESNSEYRLHADFMPGVVTLDGRAVEWDVTHGFDFDLLPALDPHPHHPYNGGKMTIKALHDGSDVFFMLQIDGDYVYAQGENTKCPSVALMFQIGENATYHNMGGCKEGRDTCTSKTCFGHEVDIMHFSIGNAIPGRLYGANPVDNRDGNGGDRFGHLVDVYSWNPHCRYLDGLGPTGNDSSAQNNWKGAWWHSSLAAHSGFVVEDSPYYASDNKKGTYSFEFSRPLRTTDRIQQDAQFTIGETSKVSVAFWYPVDEKPWHGSGHFSIHCDWVPLEISMGDAGSEVMKSGSRSSLYLATLFSLLLSLVALCISVFVGYKAYLGQNGVPFIPMQNL